MRVDSSLAKGLAGGALRRAPKGYQICTWALPRKTEARMRYLERMLRRDVGKNLLFCEVRGKGRRAQMTALWLESDVRGMRLVAGLADKKDFPRFVSNIFISQHALERMFSRLNTTDLARVGENLLRLISTWDEEIPSNEFGLKTPEGVLVFRLTGEEIIAVTFLTNWMKHNLSIINAKPTEDFNTREHASPVVRRSIDLGRAIP